MSFIDIYYENNYRRGASNVLSTGAHNVSMDNIQQIADAVQKDL